MMKNTLVSQEKTFPAFIKSEKVLQSLTKTLGSETKKSEFVSSVISAVQTNPALQNCDFNSIVNAALLGSSLKLAHSPQLGQYYMVPYNKNAQFQLGYKGYIQLAIRSGKYKKLNVLPIKEGELIKYDPLNEEIEVNMIEDEDEREKAKTIGYYAMFEYHDGFRKVLYWSYSKMLAHAKRYSKSFNSSTSVWKSDFDAMACKTMLRQLISKWGTMSVDFQKAYENDMAVITEKGPQYVDNPSYEDTHFTEIPVQDRVEPTVDTENIDQPTLL